ncbi:hypothetical protein HanRHA438_Chr16g0757261 [Helianthus annuus]|nr:hypothetical protein HanRHA438_Chr16g0757261 [Helianthus annuus]
MLHAFLISYSISDVMKQSFYSYSYFVASVTFINSILTLLSSLDINICTSNMLKSYFDPFHVT